jgi:hypothetical protein
MPRKSGRARLRHPALGQGSLARSLPIGYARSESGSVTEDPDRQIRSRLAYIFRLFDRHKVAPQVLPQLVREELQVPAKVWGGPRHGQVRWKEPDLSDVIRLPHNPTYAGASVYGQWEYDPFDRSPTNGEARVHSRPMEEWPVGLRDTYPAYIAWEEFVRNQAVLRSNGYGFGKRGAARRGEAPPRGIAYRGRCGARMSVLYYSTREKRAPGYGCFYEYHRHGGETCQCFSSAGVDAAVAGLFLDVVSPAKVEIALHALEGGESDHAEAREQWELQLRGADPEVDLARRRHEASDPENRLVTAELEALWEGASRQRERLQRERTEFERRREHPVGKAEREQIRDLASDLGRVWEAETTPMEGRETLVRFLIKRVHLDGISEAGKIRIDVEWHTDARTALTIDRPLVGVWAPRTPRVAVERIREPPPGDDHDAIAVKLNAEGFRTAKGLKYDDKSVGYVARTRGWGRGRGRHGKRSEA